MRYMLGGKVSVPLVMRMPAGSGTGAAAQHSQSLEAWFAHVPGLKVVQPATPHDAKGLLLAALDDPDPVIVFEHKLLYKMKGQVPEGYYRVADRQGRRSGARARDLTIVASAIMVHRALEAAKTLAAEGISAEVIDLRTIRPLDRATIVDSVARPASSLCVYEGVKTLGHRRRDQRARSPRARPSTISTRRSCGSGGAEAPIPYNPDPREGGGAAGARTSRPRRAGSCGGRSEMPVEVIMPKVDMDMATGKLAAWHVDEGDDGHQGRAALRHRDRQGGDGGRGAGDRAAAPRDRRARARPSTSASRSPGSMPRARRSGRSRPARRPQPEAASPAPEPVAAAPAAVAVNGGGRGRRGARDADRAPAGAGGRDRAVLDRRQRAARPHPARGRGAAARGGAEAAGGSRGPRRNRGAPPSRRRRSRGATRRATSSSRPARAPARRC